MCDEPEWRLIREIRESDLGLPSHAQGDRCEVRTRAEAVVVNPAGQVALLYAVHCHYHSLPGGRVRRGESLVVALRREIREETGADVEVLFREARAFPSYLQAGPSFFIEKSKRRMIAEDIAAALRLARASVKQ